MRIAFLILRKNYYRLLAPAVDAALARGWDVQCWHDWSHPRRGGKSYEFPDAPPAFRAGAPEIRTFQGYGDLARRWSADSPDVVICLDPPDAGVKAAARSRWVWLQYSTDIVCFPTPQGILDADAVGAYSPYWVDKLQERYAGGGLAAGALRKVTPVGVPELDATRLIDADKVRARLGLPPGQPVVLYLPFPLRSNPQTFWLRHAYTPSSRASQALRVLLAGRREHQPHVASGANDKRLVEAVRAFCDRSGAALVMKAREKDPVPAYARRLADRVIYDPSVYPATILELLRISAFCIHFYSTAAFEAAYCGVPSLCLAPEASDMGLPDLLHDFVHNGKPGGIYNWPDVAYWRPLAEAFDGLARWRVEDFPLAVESRRDYVERFLGFDDGQSSARLLDAAAQMLHRPR